MQLIGKHAEATAETIVELFNNLEYLVQSIETIFVLRKDIAPCRRSLSANKLETAPCQKLV